MTARSRTAALFLASAVVLTTAASTGSALAAPARAPLDGAWRMDGYGTVVSIEDGGRRLRTYDTTAVSCLPGFRDATRTTAPGTFQQDKDAPITVTAQGRDRAVLSFGDNVGHRTLRRLPALPAECREDAPAKTDNLRVFDVFWQTYAENYPFFAQKGINWNEVREKFRPRAAAAADDTALFEVLKGMIEPLHDGHTGIVADPGKAEGRFGGHREDTTIPGRDGMLRIDKAVKESVGVPEARWRTWGDGRISYAELPGRTGYLRITGFQGYTEDGGYAEDSAVIDRALDEIFTAGRTRGPGALRGLVLDLRFNGGGSDRLALRVAERLTDRPYLAYLKHARNDPRDPRKFTPEQPVTVTPHRGPVYTGPVAVLTGRLTISAGETLTQALMGRARPTERIGENTQGSFSDTLERRLPNGWRFILPNEEFLSAQDHRTTYDITGISPDVATPVFTEEEFRTHRDSALAEARRFVARAGR
ncbi:S41 family peptidase [Streptomyces rectiverticillatus]|uniref:S41 family peptidase n=1 Tax=Streptomyces rectiverticillatus TaxID=173860 RepID=UPI0015C3B85F|nr:S41 family peptidase [Streptomyces rectiverticillatus]QLE71453.1 S41 family peptidase [Streptomyces rectiverticillatus]